MNKWKNFIGNKWRKYILIFLIGLVILLGFWFIVNPNEKTNNFIKLLGTYLEIYSLIVMFLEILEVKTITEQIDSSIQQTKSKFDSILSLTDISKSTKTIDEIQSYLGNNQVQMAYLRLKDLRKVMIQSEFRELFDLLKDPETIQICYAKVNSDIDDLNSSIYHNGNIDRDAVSKNLEKLSSAFTTLEEIIKKINV